MKRNDDIAAAIAKAVEPFAAELAAELGKILAEHAQQQIAAARQFAIDKLQASLAANDQGDEQVDPDLEPETEADPARHPRAPKSKAQQERVRAKSTPAKAVKPPPGGRQADGERQEAADLPEVRLLRRQHARLWPFAPDAGEEAFHEHQRFGGRIRCST